MTDIARLVLDADTRGLKKGERALDDVSRSSKRTAGEVDRQNSIIAKSYAKVGVAIAAAFSVGDAIRKTIQFQDAMAEVSTLVDTATVSMGELNKMVLAQSQAFGAAPTDQAKALYQIISAGASSAAQANDILTASNKLAIGGVTDVATAADGLTSVLNAYGPAVGTATEVSDALFTAMKAGKTTIGELSSSIGTVAPLAAQLGVSFDELTAATAALTKGGITTNVAITGIRAVLAAVAKPSAEAAKLAKELGVEFSAAGLQAKGFAGFMADLTEKTGGNQAALAQLFGGVEALVPVLALSGQAGEDFTAIMQDMAVKAGATEDAFNKMANSPGFQLDVLFAKITSQAISFGTSVLDTLLPAIKSLNTNFDTIVKIIGVLLTSFAAYKVAVIASAATTTLLSGNLGVLIGIIATTTRNFGLLAGAQVTATAAAAGATTVFRTLTATLLANPFTAVAVALATLTAGMWAFASSQRQAKADTDALIGSLQGLAEARSASFELEATKAEIELNKLRDERSRLEIELAERGRSPTGLRGIEFGAAESALSKVNQKILETETSINRARSAFQKAGAALNAIEAPAAGTAAAVGGIGREAKKTTTEMGKFLESVSDEAPRRLELAREAFALGAISAGQFREEVERAERAVRKFGRVPDSEIKAISQGAGLFSDRPTRPLFEATIVEREAERLVAAAESAAKGVKDNTVKIAESFARMAQNAIDSIRGLVDSIKNGGFLSILSSVFGIIDRFGILGGSKGAGSLFGTLFGRANGGQVDAGRPFLVGERGPELFIPRSTGTINPSPQGSPGGRLNVTITMDQSTGSLGAFVRDEAGRLVAESAPMIVAAAEGRTVRTLQRPRLAGLAR